MFQAPGRFIPMVHVQDIGRSIAFYEKLGFAAVSTFTPEGVSQPTWASLESGEARLMVVLADGPIDMDDQGALFYVYYEDVVGIHADLTARDLRPGEIRHPHYRPKGEFRLIDPDGYCLMITHT